MFSFRPVTPLNACAALCISILFCATVHADGGFVGLQGGITDSQDMDDSGNTIKVIFGPDITRHLSLEFGLMDIGEASYRDPSIDFSEADDDNPPVFSDTSHGSVNRSTATDTEQSVAIYTGFASVRPQSFLITFRYNLPLSDSVGFFLKTGANIWWADYDIVEIKAWQDGSSTRRIVDSRQTSAVDQISGGGFIWKVIKTMSIRAEIETTALDSKDFERVRFQLLTIGGQYDF